MDRKMPRALNLKAARTSIFSLTILGYFIVIDQRAWVAEAKSNIITLVCSGKTTSFLKRFPDKPAVVDYKHVFVVDLDKKLVDDIPAKVDEKSISSHTKHDDGSSRWVDINRGTGAASISLWDNDVVSEFSGSCVRSEGTKF